MEDSLSNAVGYALGSRREIAQVEHDQGATDMAHSCTGYLHVDPARGGLATAVEIYRLCRIGWRGEFFLVDYMPLSLIPDIVGSTPVPDIAVRVREEQTSEARRSPPSR